MSSNKSRTNPLLLAGSAVLACGAAIAQDAATPTEDVTIEEVVVTAQKREQSLSDVAAAVTALTSDRLVTSQVAGIQDLQTIIPSVNFGSDFNQAKIFIRGVGANTSTTGNSTAVALHVDGAVVSRAEAQLTSLFDLERVEVLRGPQGTLYGRNATGGSINLITAKPTQELSGYARLTYGNYDALTTEAALAGGITDQLSARIAVKNEQRDGFGVNPVTGKDVDDLNRRMARAQLKYDFTDDVSLLVAGELFRQDDSSGAVHYLRASFPGVARLAPLGVGGYAVKPRDLASEVQPGTQTDSKSWTATLKVGATDNLSFTNIANYRTFKTSLFQDLDLSAIQGPGTAAYPTTVQERRIDSEQYSNELQVNWSGDFLNVVGGLFYFHERQQPIDNVGFGLRNGLASNIAKYQGAGLLATAYELCGYQPDTVGNSALIAPKRVCTKSDLKTEAYAIFGQANLNLGRFSDQLADWTLKLGGRYSKEDVDTLNRSVVILGGGAGAVNANSGVSFTNSRKFSDFTPELGLQWQPSKDMMAYYTYSEGFKAGSGENAAFSTTIVDPEQIKNHEAGIKASFLDRRLSANLAAYHYKLGGAQLNKTIAGGPTGYTTIFQNAASTSADGVELELAARLARGVRMSGAVSYTDATFDNYLTLDPLNPANIAGGTPYNATTNPDPTAFGAPGGGNIQLAGNRVRNTPDWAWNVHGEYDLPFSLLNDGYLTFLADVSGKSRVYFSEYERQIESAKGYTMVDASLQFTSGNDHLRVQLWAKNLTGTDRASSTFALATGRLLGVTYLQPRTYGLTVNYRL